MDRRRLGSAAVTVVLIVLLLVAAGVIYQLSTSRIAVQGTDNTRLMRVIGLGNPVTNRLDPRFTDANLDLLADVPADAATLRDPKTLRFSYLTTEGTDIEPADFAALLKHLEAATGRPVEYVSLATVNDQIRALANGELDITGFNTGAVPWAVNAAGFIPVCGPSVQGKPASYRMVFVVPANSELKTPDDLRGQSVTFTRYGSNSGYKAPLSLLYEQFKLEPQRDYQWSFSQSHQASIQGAADGKFAVVATASDLLDAAIASGAVGSDKVRVLYESEPFPTAAIGHAHDLAPALAQSIRDALLSAPIAGTPIAQGADALSPVVYKDAFGLVWRIDNAVGFQYEVPEEAPAELPFEIPADAPVEVTQEPQPQ